MLGVWPKKKHQLFIREEFSLELAVDKLYTRTECWIARSMALGSLKLKNYINQPRQIRKKRKKSKQKKTHYYESSSERQDWNKFKTLQLSEPSSSFEPRQSLSLFATLAHFMLCKYLMSQGFLLRTSVKN